MHVITLIVAIIAAVLFAIEGAGKNTSGKSLIAWGLCLFVVAFILAFTLAGDDMIYLIE